MNPFAGILEPKIPEGFKRCRYCYVVKRLDMFAALHTRKDGHFGKCEDCRKESLEARKRQRHERYLATKIAKPRKPPMSPEERKAKDSARARAKYEANREQMIEKSKRRYHEKTKHDPQAKAYQREYHARRNAKFKELARLRAAATIRVKDSSIHHVTPDWSWLRTQEQS